MRDVATLASVSQMTVSHVVNGSKRVHDATRDAVLQAIETLNYKPNLSARQLAKAQNLRVALFYSTAANAFLSSVLLGTMNAASRLGIQLQVERFDLHGGGEIGAAIERMLDGGADGLLLPSPLCELAVRSGWDAARMPTVAIAPGMRLPELTCVRADEQAAAREMTDLLIGRGHRRIGFVKGPVSHSASASRLAGFREAMAAHSLTVDPALVVPGNFDFDSGAAAAATLLDRAAPPSAIFAGNDATASGVVALAHRRRIDVPGQLSVVGFDDTPIATQIWPPLTTVRQNIVAMAEAAVDLLCDMLSDDPAGPAVERRDRIIDYCLIERESVGDLAPRDQPHRAEQPGGDEPVDAGPAPPVRTRRGRAAAGKAEA